MFVKGATFVFKIVQDLGAVLVERDIAGAAHAVPAAAAVAAFKATITEAFITPAEPAFIPEEPDQRSDAKRRKDCKAPDDGKCLVWIEARAFRPAKLVIVPVPVTAAMAGVLLAAGSAIGIHGVFVRH